MNKKYIEIFIYKKDIKLDKKIKNFFYIERN